MKRSVKFRRAALLALGLIVGLVIYRGCGRDRHEFVTQRPGEPKRVWRSMRTVWTFRPGIEGYHSSLSDLVCRGNRLFYACECEAGCVATDSGGLLWRHSFMTLKAAANASSASSYESCWKITADDSLVYVLESHKENSPPQYFSHLRALRIADGKAAWELSLNQSALDRPCLAGDLLLIPLDDGTLLAVKRANGQMVWRKAVMAGAPLKTHTEIGSVMLQASDQIAVAQVGASRLAAFRVQDGNPIWSYPKDSHDADGSSEGPVLKDGTVYALLDRSKLVAIEAKTGKPFWTRSTSGGGSPSSVVMTLGDKVITEPSSTVVAVRQRDGRTQWLGEAQNREYLEQGPMPLLWNGDAGAADHSGNALFAVRDCLPLINGVPTQVRSQQSLETLVMLDLATGRERWRWQPEDGKNINKIASDGDRFYISDGGDLRAVEEGQMEPLPTTPNGRRKRAQQMVFARFDWSDAKPPLQKLSPTAGTYRSQPPLPGSLIGMIRQLFRPLNSSQTKFPENTEATLTLLRLGRDSVPALLSFVQHEAAQKETTLPAPGAPEYYKYASQPMSQALDLLLDIGDLSIVPTLMQQMEHCKHPGTRQVMAETLIRTGDPRAVPALFRYAKSNGNMTKTRQDALYWVCRALGNAPDQKQVMDYLLRCLSDNHAPSWLRLFARFELLNDRGEKAKQAALASFEGEDTAPILPRDSVLAVSHSDTITFDTLPDGMPKTLYSPEIARENTGRSWAVFKCDYLGDENDLWFVQSMDGKRWTHPAFGINLTTRCSQGGSPEDVKFKIQNKTFEIAWKENVYSNSLGAYKKIPHLDRLAIAALYRDRDSDGLPDLVERRIGTDPGNPDTNGDGIPDSRDKNALYRSHALTDEEGIFQAVVEALCQVGRSAPDKPDVYQWLLPIRFGGSRRPLILSLPPGSSGVKIRGHRGPVLFRPLHNGEDYPSLSLSMEQYNRHFTPPLLDLSGIYQDSEAQEWRQAESSSDPFDDTEVSTRSAPSRHTPTFHDYFPYVKSADGNRACVGWVQSDGSLWGSRAVIYDIEVRKIAGRWYPVLCRRIHAVAHHYFDEIVVPLTLDHRAQ